ncbi:uncharacterized protein LOC122073166 [Macadamia integrifolia]|uniref:uncharacterized protein LOC122073166 n=1 Tax=Macadamia integrifolia TaxID=60698 RepID=UPI001C4EC0E4|nr:uncharacterized protein LOC122073166 [Macadamia integrifolia]XP_042493637.1 uncharacterized protein LOC122073166 [Macadamia integrifolia]XP_042493638.1 uncharacterized protein LOC122073166 [Macadamia integrifolia]
MTGDDGSSSDRWHKNRPILADVTNQHGKRRLLSISSSPGLDKGNRFQDNVEGKVPDSEFVQKVCLGVENLVRGKCKRECIDDGNGKDLPLTKPMGLCGLLNSGSGRVSVKDAKPSGISGIASEIKDLPTVLDGDIQSVGGNAVTSRTLEIGDGRRDCGSSGVIVPEFKSGSSASVIVEGGSQGGEEIAEAGVERDVIKSSMENEVLEAHFHGDNDELMDGGDLTSTKATLAGSSSYQGSEQEMCAGSGFADGLNANHGVDMLSVCSCSFCLKAAYIWSDLHYQDVKGRIAALKKSRKEVKCCVDRSLNQYETDKNGMPNLNISEKLELDLMGRWNSLFLHTEDIFVRESTQLQSSLLSLKELRGSCKIELEKTNGIPSNK